MSLSALIKTQLGYKSMIERTYTNFKKSPKDRLTSESYLLTRIETLEEKWKVFSDTHLRLIAESSTAELEKTNYVSDNVYECVEELYIECKAEIKQCLSNLKPSKVVVTDSQASTHYSKAESINVKLPKITIPTFNGSYSEWTTFKDLYESLVHNNTGIDNVQKMHYLKCHLSGEAEQLLRHVPITAANYQESWNTLNNRYNNKKYLANCLLKRFMNQSSLGLESSSALKNMLDVTNDTLHGLRNLGIDVNSWDTIIIYTICSKLDPESRKEWESKISSSDDLPTWSQMQEFLESRFRSLEFLDPKQRSKPGFSNHIPKVMHAMTTSGSNVVAKAWCAYCKSNEHKMANCKEFIKLDYDQRHNFVQTSRLCFNCLGSNHSVTMCRSPVKCRICHRKHHSLLHPKPSESIKSNLAAEITETVSRVKTSLEDPGQTSKVVAHFSTGISSRKILLATALVEAEARDGDNHTIRALLDQGSEASFVTESAAQLLGMKKIHSRSSISGLGNNKEDTLTSNYVIVINIKSRHDPGFNIKVKAHVLPTITSLLPSERTSHVIPEFAGLTLADPQFYIPNKIDILLGADVYGALIREGLIKGTNGRPTAQNTALRWIISGPTQAEESSTQHCHHSVVSMHAHVNEDAMLRKFWEIESTIPEKKILTKEEARCEEVYAATTIRDESGRYIVSLPFRTEDPQCQYSRSKDLAVRRFQHLERKFSREPEIKKQYSEVFHEYLNLGHMELIPADDASKTSTVYLPHHAVIRNDKTTSKIRIVFDASMKGTNRVSLNDDLMVGPTLQPPLRHIIMRWRMHPISICADVIKMYRQVKVTSAHTDFQRVVWRDDPASEIKEYRLLRVTFGTASAPYLAIKSLQQIADDEGSQFPGVPEIIKNDFYVDDLMTGCQTVKEGLTLHKNIESVLTKGGFQLQKWVSSCKELNNQISGEVKNMKEKGEDQGKKDIKMDEIVKMLGISWDRESDEFKYSVTLPQQQTPITKRKVISDISRLFDPLGWAAPCVITSKIFIQRLWLSGLDWDEELTSELLTEWQVYRQNLLQTQQFNLPRWVNTSTDDLLVELHGFSDASEAAYAAVVYIRVLNVHEIITTRLITARTRVAPVKQLSIPKLELMGAVLLSELITEVAEVMRVDHTHIHAWTDSTVVLAWLSSHPSRWTTFVGNRVSTILTRLDNSHWAHVQSAHNPADIASRGATAEELVCNTLWAHGPSWLSNRVIDYTRPKSIATNIEQRNIKTHIGTEKVELLWTRFSSLTRLVRIIAYCRRVLKWKPKVSNERRYETYLTKEEIDEAMKVCIKNVQRQEFSEEIETIRKTGRASTRGKLKPLCPTIDEEGILRVSGRLQHALLSENTKNPIIMPHNNHFTLLLVADAHKATLHGGPTLMLHYLRNKFWIISAKNLVKTYVRKCVKCKRYAAATQTQLMGQLPASRVTPARSFKHSGVDFAGPINIRTSKGRRGHQSYKGYICLFICTVSKAIHLEAISDLSSQGFIAGFKRFVARRGVVTDMYSDNGTNFVGASKELKHLVDVERSSVATEIQEWLGNNTVSWHFIPPHAPNFGGLWEAGVKSTKFHLRRVVGESTLTYEELSTVLCQIEACLNSRPLSVIPDGPNDSIPLTPGHFLIGEPLITVPDRCFDNINIGSIKRWQLTQRMLQDFWKRWSQEYLVHLLHRYKWNKQIPEPKIGDIVLVKEDNLPPARWLLGKVTEKHPGLDKMCRVVTLKCNGSFIKRPVSKLCILPVSD